MHPLRARTLVLAGVGYLHIYPVSWESRAGVLYALRLILAEQGSDLGRREWDTRSSHRRLLGLKITNLCNTKIHAHPIALRTHPTLLSASAIWEAHALLTDL